MKKKCIFLFIFLFLWVHLNSFIDLTNVFSYDENTDFIIYNGEKYKLYVNPMEIYFN